MKKLIMLIAMCLPVWAMAQTDSLATKPADQYCRLITSPKAFSNGDNLTVDYGKHNMVKLDKLKNQDGTSKNIDTAMDALNYMASLGWELVNAYSERAVDNSYGTFYILRNKQGSHK